MMKNDRTLTANKTLSKAEARNTLLELLYEFIQKPVAEMADYLRHVGFDTSAVKTPDQLRAAWCAFYRTGKGHYDVNRAFTDFATWPPIANRIAELRAEQAQDEVES